RLLPLVLEPAQLAGEAVAARELVGVVERFEEGERAPGVGERRLRRPRRPSGLGEGAVVVDAQARGGELVRERGRLLDERARPLLGVRGSAAASSRRACSASGSLPPRRSSSSALASWYSRSSASGISRPVSRCSSVTPSFSASTRSARRLGVRCPSSIRLR